MQKCETTSAAGVLTLKTLDTDINMAVIKLDRIRNLFKHDFEQNLTPHLTLYTESIHQQNSQILIPKAA